MQEEREDMGYDVLDGCYGTVIGRCQTGVYLTLDNGEDAFAYKFQSLYPGAKVLCTVKRLGNEYNRKLVTIDSVCHTDRDYAA